MKCGIKFTSFLACALAIGHLAFAQFDINGPNASLTMQGQVPSVADPVAHDISVATPGNFVLRIDSGANSLQGIIMLASLAQVTGPQFPTVLWGGSIDIGQNTIGLSSILIIADGIGFTVNPSIDAFFRTDAATAIQPGNDFALTYSVNQFFCGGRNAWQAIVQEPTAPPIFLDNTEAGDANYTSGQDLVLLTGNDGVVQVPFLAGSTFPFHGVAYSDVFVNGNGYVNFGSFTTVTLNGFTIDTVSFVNSEPAIAVCLADWDIAGGGGNDGVWYSEIAAPSGGSQFLISWGDPRGLASGAPGVQHSFGGDTNNQFDLILFGDLDPVANPCGSPASGTAGNFSMRWPRLDTTAIQQRGNGAFGHTPGAAGASGLPTSGDLLGQVNSTTTGVAAVEEHDTNGTNGSIVGWNGAGALRSYNNLFAATGVQVDFLATTSVVPGDLGYVSVPTTTPADDVSGVLNTATSAGGFLTIVGKFFGFGGGTVDIVDASATAFTGLAGTVSSGTGPIFASEGLVVNYPPLALGPATITVNFGSGYTETLTITVLSPCSAVQNFPLNDDQSVLVTLTNPVTHYGVTYTQFNLTSNGLIGFTGGTFGWIPSVADLFSGTDSFFGIPFGPAIAAAWGDLNPFASSGYDVIEDTCTGEVLVSFTNQNYWITTSPAGNFSVTLNWGGVPDQVLFDYSGLLNDTGAGATYVVGLSDGVTGTDTDFGTIGGIAANIPGYVSATGPDSIAEALTSSTMATTLQSIVGASGPGTFAVLNSGATGILVAF